MKTNIQKTEGDANRQKYEVNEKQKKSRKIKCKDQLGPNPHWTVLQLHAMQACIKSVFLFLCSFTLVNIPFILEHDLLNSFISAFTIFISHSTLKSFTSTTFYFSNLCPRLLSFTKGRFSAREHLYSPSLILCDCQAIWYVGKVTNRGCRVIMKHMF